MCEKERERVLIKSNCSYTDGDNISFQFNVQMMFRMCVRVCVCVCVRERELVVCVGSVILTCVVSMI